MGIHPVHLCLSTESTNKETGSLALPGQSPPYATLGFPGVFEEVTPPAVVFFAVGLLVQIDVRLRTIGHGLHGSPRESLHGSQKH